MSCLGRKNRDSQLNPRYSDVYRSAGNLSMGYGNHDVHKMTHSRFGHYGWSFLITDPWEQQPCWIKTSFKLFWSSRDSLTQCFWSGIRIHFGLKCWIRNRNETIANPKHCFTICTYLYFIERKKKSIIIFRALMVFKVYVINLSKNLYLLFRILC